MKNYNIDGYTIIHFEKNTGCIEDFIRLPKSLYPSKLNPQDSKAERQLLLGEHVLSKYFRLEAFLLKEKDTLIGRGALTFYKTPKDTAYLGFFEMQDNNKAASAFFKILESFAKEEGYLKISGPMNASFWIGYRMKSNNFDEIPYFGEPYNLPYYKNLWLENGYHICDEYISNLYGKLSNGIYENKKYQNRLKKFKQAGYELHKPSKHTWDNVICEVYKLIINLYSSFPSFSPISEEDFVNNYSGLKLVLDFSLCRIAYYNNKAVGFVITIPDYGTFLNEVNLLKIPGILWKKYHSKRYVVLYLGVDDLHKGLGTAMIQELIQEFSKRKITPIGALIHKGKVTQGYGASMINKQNKYLMLEKDISTKSEKEEN